MGWETGEELFTCYRSSNRWSQIPRTTGDTGSSMSGPDILALWKRAARLLHQLPDNTVIGLGPKTSTAKDEAEKADRRVGELTNVVGHD